MLLLPILTVNVSKVFALCNMKEQQSLFCQACLAWWNVVSPFGGFGSTAALAFVLIVAAVKAIFEDKKRHQEDHRTNKSIAHVVHGDGE